MRQITLLLILSAMLAPFGCSPGKRVEAVKGPVFDKSIGLTEAEVVRQAGTPSTMSTTNANQFVGELQFPLRSKVTNGEVLIRELYYKRTDGERIFWLTQQGSNGWVVISDVMIPPGVEF